MEVIVEIVVYVIGELLLTVIGEALVELGFHSLSEAPGSRMSRRVFLGLIYAVAGIALGALSLKIVPLLIFGGPAINVGYFIVAPIIAGLALCLVSWLMNYGIDDRAPFFQAKKFVYGVLFALMFSLTRTIFG